MQRIIRAVTEGDARAGDRLVRSQTGGPGGIEVQRVHDEYEQLKKQLGGQALTAPIPSGTEVPQVLQTGLLPVDPRGLYLIEYLSLGRGNLPRITEYRQITPLRVEMDTAVNFHFETLEYRRYPNHTAVTFTGNGNTSCYQIEVARIVADE